MNLEERLGKIPTRDIFGETIAYAERELGREGQQPTIRYYIHLRAEYRSKHPSPDIRDDKANDLYKREINLYAAKETIEWINKMRKEIK